MVEHCLQQLLAVFGRTLEDIPPQVWMQFRRIIETESKPAGKAVAEETPRRTATGKLKGMGG